MSVYAVPSAARAEKEDAATTTVEIKDEVNALDKREKVIRDKLARLARVPAGAIFEFVFHLLL